jgi:hypothetical protein
MPPDGFHHFIEGQLTKCVIYCTVSQHWISLTGGKRDPVFCKILKINDGIVIFDCIDG